MKLSRLTRPFICADLSEKTVRSFVRRIEEIEGSFRADSFEINLAPLKAGRVGDIFSVTDRPCIVTNRRPRVMRSYGFSRLRAIGERDRMRRMLSALDAGAAALDMEIDTFDFHGEQGKPQFGSKEEEAYARNPRSRPVEFTENRTAMREQEKVIGQVHAVGGEVLMSCHSQLRMKARTAIELGGTMADRGADFAKVVMMTFDSRDVLRLLSCVLEMKSRENIPFNLMNQGPGAHIGRLLSAAFGSAWVFCRPEKGFVYHGQPTVREAKEFLKSFKF
jgi:3-dehydroquinate dehydratase type I